MSTLIILAGTLATIIGGLGGACFASMCGDYATDRNTTGIIGATILATLSGLLALAGITTITWGATQ